MSEMKEERNGVVVELVVIVVRRTWYSSDFFLFAQSVQRTKAGE